MTLGEKISYLRKNKGMTQQELGDYLKITPQAISKWESDMAQPDINNIQRMCALFQISVDKFLNIESREELADVNQEGVVNVDKVKVEDIIQETVNKNQEANKQPKVLGHCVGCGIVVTGNNVGIVKPKVLCKDCYEKAKKRRAQQEKIKLAEEEAERAEIELERKNLIRKRNKGLILGVLPAILFLALGIIASIGETNTTVIAQNIAIMIVLAYASYAYVAQLCMKGVVRRCLYWGLDWLAEAIDFDMGSLIWIILIGWIVIVFKIVIGVLMLLLGLLGGLVIAPFSFPFVLYHTNKEIKNL